MMKKIYSFIRIIKCLYKFDGLSDFEPYDINLIFEKAYYYLLVLPEPIETSKFSKEIFDLFSDALNSK